MRHHHELVSIKVSIIIILSLLATVQGSRLTVEEALHRINRLPQAFENAVSRMTNNVHLKFVSDDDNRKRVINGTATTIEDNPHHIALLFRHVQVCGGSIISSSWVLTAAHCLDWYPLNSDISVRSGSTSRSSGGTVHAIYYYHIHEQYNPLDYPYDVGTIRVRTPFSGPARAIIPLANFQWVTDYEVIVTGWGFNEFGATPDNLHKVILPVVDQTTCNATWDNLITDDMICAGDMGIDSCDGDSGGPAVQNGMQYGIVSWGATSCGNGLPGVYTYVGHPSIRNFIKGTTGV